MHLLLAQKGTIADGEEAVDLDQSPADLLFLTAADTEIGCIAGARMAMGERAPLMRAANLLQLRHPMSVDIWIERTARHAKLIVVRLLGGESYWPYGLESLHALALNRGIKFAVLPGDDKPDSGLERFCTLDRADCAALWRYFAEGGAENAAGFLSYCRALIEGGDKPAGAAPLLKAGVYGLPTSPLRGGRAEDAGGGQLNDSSTPTPNPSPQGGGGRRSTAAIVFYRALVQSGQTAAISALADALEQRGMAALPVYVTSLKDEVSAATVGQLFEKTPPDVVLNCTGFAVSSPSGERQPTVLEAGGAPVLQVVLSSSTREAWEASAQGLSARDLAMNVALPEVDGRVLTRAVSFKAAARFDPDLQTNIITPEPVADRVAFVADLAAKWIALRRKPASERAVAIVLANYPNRDGRLANGVGLDTPAGTVEVLKAMMAAGYATGDYPADGDALIAHLKSGVTNAATDGREIRETISLNQYRTFFASLPKAIQAQVTARWGDPERDPFFLKKQRAFALPLTRFGKVLVGIQPARGYNIDPKETYHSPDLVPPHGYLAFYAHLRAHADAVVHMGKHGNLEWLPGKALALSENCFPEAVFGPLPHLYPFIVNDPGEGTQAKRRTSAVIIDHLTPPLTRAESYGPLKDLERLVDEYYDASGSDPRRLVYLKRQILDLVRDIGLDHDAGIAAGDGDDAALQKLDAYLCELKEMQIRDGLHIFGRAPEGRLLTDLVVALARLPRGDKESLHRAIAGDVFGMAPPSALPGISPSRGEIRCTPDGGQSPRFQQKWPAMPFQEGLGTAFQLISPLEGEMPGRAEGGDKSFDPLSCIMSDLWTGPKPPILQSVSIDPWRTNGDTVERIELLAAALVAGEIACPEGWERTRTVLEEIESKIRPSIEACGKAEIAGLLTGLDGRFVAPGPSGAPTRGKPDVLPTGRNFFSVDTRAVPTEAAWALGKKSAELLVTRHAQDHGNWPTSIGLTAWGTSNMRTGGDDIAQAFALIGAKPVWERASGRVTGYEIVTLAELGRPRVDVTLRISGFFRDAFPDQIALFDRAVRAVGALDEDEADNPIAARMRRERATMIATGASEADAARRAGYRVFGSKPGSYGAGLQALIDERGWTDKADLAEAYLVWGSYAYGHVEDGSAERGLFEERLGSIEAVVQNQDNREHDLLDSDDYYQFEGGMTAAVEQVRGVRPTVYHNDHSRPERPVIRTLEDEIGRVVRARAVNPKWIAGVMRHGYKGAFEMAATVDFLFAFAATTGAVRDHHFEAVYQAYLADERVRAFLADKNPGALREIAERLAEAIDRGLWTARSNSARFELREMAAGGIDRPPSALPGISPSRGEISYPTGTGQSPAPQQERLITAFQEKAKTAFQPISPLEGEMPGRAEGGDLNTQIPAIVRDEQEAAE